MTQSGSLGITFKGLLKIVDFAHIIRVFLCVFSTVKDWFIKHTQYVILCVVYLYKRLLSVGLS